MFTQLVLSTIFLLFVFTASLSVWRWLSNLAIARKMVVDHAQVDNPSCIVTLVHGTFAKNAPWTSPDSRLAERLEEAGLGPVQVRRFSWSGRNSFGARRQAAATLTQDIDDLRRQYPALPHYLIGHSHGGNVAINASLASIEQSVAGVVCLATPVLTTCRRRLTGSRQIMVGFGFFLVLYLPLIDLGNTGRGELTTFGMAWMLAAGLGATLWTLKASSLAAKLDSSRSAANINPRRLAFIRAPFDEASGLISTANFASWMLTFITTGPFGILDRFERPGMFAPMVRFVLLYLGSAAFGAIAVYAASEIPSLSPIAFIVPFLLAVGSVAVVVSVALIALAVAARPLRLARNTFLAMFFLWPLFLVANIIGGLLLLPAIVIASVLFAATVGVEMLICAMFLEVTSEPCPPGRWTLRQLPAPPEGRLRHSSLYLSDEGLSEIISALAAMPETHFRDLRRAELTRPS